MIVALCNVLTSIFAGCVIFPIIGYLAKELNMPIDQVVDQGLSILSLFCCVAVATRC